MGIREGFWGLTGFRWGGRRDVCTAQKPGVRCEPAPKPFKPPRRSNRECVAKNSLVHAHREMRSAEKSDETTPDDEYVPGKSLILRLAGLGFSV